LICLHLYWNGFLQIFHFLLQFYHCSVYNQAFFGKDLSVIKFYLSFVVMLEDTGFTSFPLNCFIEIYVCTASSYRKYV